MKEASTNYYFYHRPHNPPSIAISYPYMIKKIEQIIQWKNQVLLDVVLSFIEAFVVLIITYLYLFVLSINYGLNTEDVNFLGAFITTVTSTLQPTEMIIYVTGILSSTTAYFIVRLTVLKTHVLRVVSILIVTLILFWIATPLFISGLQSPPVNQTFAVGLAKILGIGALIVWLFSIFSQRRILKREITISGDQRGNEIAKNVGSP